MRRRQLDGSPPRHLQDESPTATPPGDHKRSADPATGRIAGSKRQRHRRDTVAPIAGRHSHPLGRPCGQNQNWFGDTDEEIQNLLKEKNRPPPDRRKKAALVQHRLPEVQSCGIDSEEIQGYAEGNETKNFRASARVVYGPWIEKIAPVLSSDGAALLTQKSQILKRWV
nr:unnamed protein product [Spirometra erinaceieuropaei]